jgi:hypothetical protein
VLRIAASSASVLLMLFSFWSVCVVYGYWCLSWPCVASVELGTWTCNIGGSLIELPLRCGSVFTIQQFFLLFLVCETLVTVSLMEIDGRDPLDEKKDCAQLGYKVRMCSSLWKLATIAPPRGRCGCPV